VCPSPAAIATATTWQVPVSQKYPAKQSVSAVQVVLHAEPEQTRPPEQVVGAGETQAPLLHVLWPTELVPEQVGPLPQVVALPG
jgi:hypothetical protein